MDQTNERWSRQIEREPASNHLNPCQHMFRVKAPGRQKEGITTNSQSNVRSNAENVEAYDDQKKKKKKKKKKVKKKKKKKKKIYL